MSASPYTTPDKVSQIRTLAKNAVALAVGGLAAQVAFVAIEALMARRLGQAAYGVFATTFAMSTMALWIVDFGMGVKLIQEGSRDQRRIPTVLGTTLGLKLILCALLYPIALWFLNWLQYDPAVITFFSVFYLYIVAMAVQGSVAAVYAARQKMEVNALFQGGTPVVILLLALILVTPETGLNGVLKAYLAAAIGMTALWTVLTFIREKPKFKPAQAIPLFAGSYQFGVGGLLSNVFYKVDTLMLAYLVEMQQVGIYAAGYKLLDLGYKMTVMAGRVVNPVLFRMSTHQPENFRKVAIASLRINTVVGLLLGMLIYVLAEPLILAIFGGDFYGSIRVLEILSLSFAFKFMIMALETILITADLQADRTKSLAFATLVNVGLNLILIPKIGILGAAAATVACDILLIFLLSRIASAPLGGMRLVRILVPPALIAGVALATAERFPGNPLIGSGLALAIFSVGLLLLRYFPLEELRFLVSSFHRHADRAGEDADP